MDGEYIRLSTGTEEFAHQMGLLRGHLEAVDRHCASFAHGNDVKALYLANDARETTKQMGTVLSMLNDLSAWRQGEWEGS